MNFPLVEQPVKEEPIDFNRFIQKLCIPNFFRDAISKEQEEALEKEIIARSYFLEQHERSERDLIIDGRGEYINYEEEDGQITKIYFKFNE
jgi:hypothetical protein